MVLVKHELSPLMYQLSVCSKILYKLFYVLYLFYEILATVLTAL